LAEDSGAGLFAATTPAATSELLAGPEVNAVLGAMNGLWGDHLNRCHPQLAILSWASHIY